MTSKEVLTESAASSVELAGSGSQEEIIGMLRIFKDKLLPCIREDDMPGLFVPMYIFRGDQQLGAGVILALKDRAILGWMKGLLRKPVITEVSVAGMKVETGTKPKGGGLTKPLASLRLTGREVWELLFAQNAGDVALRDALSKFLSGTLPAVDTVSPGSTESKCASCGGAVDAEDRFCASCGQDLAALRQQAGTRSDGS